MNPVPPYAGQNQTSLINVPATIVYKSYQYSPEEGPWMMLPYANLYPPPAPATQAYLPPPLGKTDLWRAMGEWPL